MAIAKRSNKNNGRLKGGGSVSPHSFITLVESKSKSLHRDEPDPSKHGPVKVLVKDGVKVVQ